MKKYKHKKTGIIVEIGVSNKNYYYAYKECEAIAKWVIEDSLDWEEVKEDVIPWHIESKSPIYITTDGVEMFEKNFTVLYLLSKELTIPSQNIAVIHNFSKQDKEVADRYLTFTSEKNRFNYIEDNSPKYSLNDIENCYPHANVTGNRIKDIPVVATLFSNLKKLGK